MRSKYIMIVIVLVTLAFGVGRLSAGSVDSPAGPTAASGQMYTLEQIYDRINDGTAATKQTTFQEPSGGPGSTMHTLDQIYDLVGQRAPVPRTGQTTSYTNYDDGYYKKGVAWPDPRFADNSDGTVTDNLTGLIWLKNANCNGAKSWSTALSWANGLYDGCTTCGGTNNDCGLSDGSKAGDWRLPNVRELSSLLDSSQDNPALPSGHPFTNIPSNSHWSSTTQAGVSASAWLVPLRFGDDYVGVKLTGSYYVWPVRGGQ